MSVSYGGESITFEDGSKVSSGWTEFKNRIINGAMTIHQRTGTITASGLVNTYGVDRWQVRTTAGSANVSMQQSSTAPVGFTNSLLLTVTTADASLASDDLTALVQKIEGHNVSDLGWGTANAQPITISFRVRSSLVGTYGVGVQNNDSTRSYPSTFTINVADTWEDKTITIPGDTTGTWNLGTTSTALYLFFSLAAGSGISGPANAWVAADDRGTTGQVNWCATLNNTFYITGVQLERGSTASSFEYRPYGTELALCQRYYCKTYQQTAAPGTATDTNCVFFALQGNCSYARTQWKFPVTMRATPTVVGYNTNNGTAGQVSADAANYSAVVSSLGDSGFAYGVNNQLIGVDTYLKWQATASAEL
jgi:hypothetical protein